MTLDHLEFPRTIYRGHPDHLGEGLHTHAETGELVGETKRCENADAFEQDQKDGWRLTREPAVDPASDVDGDAPLDPSKAKKAKK